MKKIQLGGRKGSEVRGYALVDDSDYEWLSQWNWYLNSCGYATRNPFVLSETERRGKLIYIHRELLKAKKSDFCDHINRNKLDNRRSNLRICTRSQNQCNTGLRKDNKSGFKGICWHERDKRWVAEIRFKNKQIRGGYHKDVITAAKEYDKFAKKYHKEFAVLNFPLCKN